MPTNQFFLKQGPYPLKDIMKKIGCNEKFPISDDFKIYGVESLVSAKENEMSFLNSIKYKDISLKTKASVCISSSNLLAQTG